MIIKVNFKHAVKNVKNSAKHATLAAATVAMCASLGLTAEESEAAQAALRDIAREEGSRQVRAIVMDMAHHDNPFGGFLA